MVAKAYVATRAFNAIRGGSLKAGANSAGVYEISWNASGTAANAKAFVIEPVVNLTNVDKASGNVKSTSATDFMNTSAGCVLTIAAGDYIWMAIKGTTDTADPTIVNANVRIKRI